MAGKLFTSTAHYFEILNYFMAFTFTKTDIPDVLVVKSQVFKDERGHFFEVFKRPEFTGQNLPEFVQDNFSHSAKGVLRGMHYQLAPFAQGKLVACLSGSIFDVAVDIRKFSPTFGKWVGVELREDLANMLYIPPGFAHGFQALTPDTRVLYKCTAEYNPAAERGIFWDDPAINISWPLKSAVMNERDKNFPLLKDADLPTS